MRDVDSLILENLYLQVILEKDHRSSMLKFGIPQDVADFLHNFDDKYSLWFADKIKNMGGFQSSSNKINWINVNLLTKMQGILDWVRNVPNVNLKQYNWDKAVEAQSEYHDNLQVKTLEGLEKNTIIKKYSDGFYWVDLESTRDCSEGGAMGHCGTTNKADTLYSLRKYFPETQTIEPFITMAISPDEGVWYQCKGKRNSKPKEEYYKYIADILIEKKCFVFKTEYSSSHDFTNKDLEEYVTDHSVEIPNSDEILEKISGNNISYKDFEKIYNNYDFTYYSIYLSDDYEEFVSSYYSFYISLNYDEFPDIPDLKSIINEKAGEYYSWRDIEHIKDMLSRFDIYSVNQIEFGTNDDSSFYIRCDIESDDSSFAMDDSGLNAFEQQCEYFDSMNTSFDREDFIEQLKLAMYKEEWIESDYSNFVEGLKEKYGGEDENSLEIEMDKDYDVDVDFPSFPNPLDQYKDRLNSAYFGFSFTNYKRDLTQEEIKQVPYLQYTIDFFKYFIYDYLDIPSVFNIKGNSNTHEIRAKLNLIFEEREKYDYEKIGSYIDLLLSKYPEMVENFKKFSDSILIPCVQGAIRFTPDNTYIKKDDIVKLLGSFKDKYGYQYIPYYSKEDNSLIGNISIYGSDIQNNIDDHPVEYNERIEDIVNNKLKEHLTKYPEYGFPKYNPELVKNFISKNMGGQMTFKEYLENKK